MTDTPDMADVFARLVLQNAAGGVIEDWLKAQIAMPLPTVSDLGTMAHAEGKRSLARSLLTMIQNKRDGK